MTAENQGDELESELVERFNLFDHLDVPPAPSKPTEQSGNVVSIGRASGFPNGQQPYRDQRRGSGWLVGAAAAAVVVGGLSFAVLGTQSSDTSAIEAGEIEAAQGEIEAPQGAVGADDGGTLVVEGATITVPASLVDDSSTPAEEEPTTSEMQPTSSTLPSTSAPETTSASPSESTASSEVETPATIIADESPLTLPAAPTTPPTTGSDNWIDLLIFEGLVTEVFTDCQSRWILNDRNEPEQVGPVSCDGGSHIIVDGQRIQTSSGYMGIGSAFNRHPRTLRPGMVAKVVAVGHANGIVSLDCAQCSVEM